MSTKFIIYYHDNVRQPFRDFSLNEGVLIYATLCGIAKLQICDIGKSICLLRWIFNKQPDEMTRQVLVLFKMTSVVLMSLVVVDVAVVHMVAVVMEAVGAVVVLRVLVDWK